MPDFDIQALLQNPLFLGGVSSLLAEPNDRYKALLGGLQQGTLMQQQAKMNKIRDLQIAAEEARQNFNPADYMQTKPVAEGSATPAALMSQVGMNQMPATLGGPVGGQTQMPMNVAPTQVQPEPGTPTGRVDMAGLLQGTLNAGLNPQAAQAMAGILDPETANQQAIALKMAEPYDLGPQTGRYVGNQQIAFNNATPPNQTLLAVPQLMAARDAALAAGNKELAGSYQSLLDKTSGAFDQEQRKTNQENLQIQRDTMNQFHQSQQKQQQDQYVQNKVNQFSTQLQKTNLPQLDSALKDVEAAFSAHPDGNIPGFGVKDSLTPTAMLSPEGQKNRQAFAKLQNIDIRTNSGLNVTDQELKRDIAAVGSGFLMPVERIKQGIGQIRHSLDAQLRNAGAGVPQEVIDKYAENGGDIDFNQYRPARTEAAPSKGGGSVSIDQATPDDIAAAIARKKGKK